jgi:hypothetical protein
MSSSGCSAGYPDHRQRPINMFVDVDEISVGHGILLVAEDSRDLHRSDHAG